MGQQFGAGRLTSSASVDDSDTPILHIDMDAFFVSVELLENPHLRGTPVIVGHVSNRSVVTSASYEARAFGVRAAMPMAVALRRCPHATVLEPHMDRFRHYSAEVMRIFGGVTPLVERVSIDEVFLDVSSVRRLWGSPTKIAHMIRQRVEEQTGLTCSVGVASTKFVAKLASNSAKPDGMFVVPPAGVLTFLHAFPVGALSGVGGRTVEVLNRQGLRTVGDVATVPLSMLTRVVGEKVGRRLHELAVGIDRREVLVRSGEKSIGHEVTFEHDVDSMAMLCRELLRLSGRVGARLRVNEISARTIAIKVRFADFTTLTRSTTLPESTDVSRRIYEEARILLDNLDIRQRVRLIGVRVDQLGPISDSVVSLWDPDDEWREVERVIDHVESKFGRHVVRPAALISNENVTRGIKKFVRTAD